ncbi:nucleolar transcription factor 1-like isoform X1 [Asterias rubens]|uniref:nucleolar transcription factor 1-like isoform X1 n=1 Tax=Asterias rubens TaxID=7604 RepID=UPI001454F9A7|nr:nucleolar transcription factor 1-like isoform X1 [Asterias rubens]
MADTEGVRGKKRSIADSQQLSDNSPSKKHAKTVFSLQDRIQLINNIQEHSPKTEKHSYKVCIAKIDWSKVAFGDFSYEVCQKEWDTIQNEIRKYRTMAEVITDALQVVQNPFSHRKLVHPDLPKQPLTPFFMFYSEKAKKFKKKHPEMPQYEISRSLALKFKELPEHKKAKYNQKYGDQRLMYQKELATFLAEHPEYKKDSRHGGGGPKPPKLLNPYQLWANKRFETLLREDKEVTRGQLDAQLREEWKIMVDKKRVKWINKALEEQVKYVKEIEEYVEQNPNFKVPEIKKPLLTKKEVRLKEGVDGKPFKPPANAYNLFCSEMLKQMGHMGSNTRAKMMECSALWSNTELKKKQDYKDRVEKLKSMYKRDLDKYIESLPEEERGKYAGELEAIERQSKKQTKASSSSSRLKPKKPISALFLFTNEQRQTFKGENPDMSDTEITRNLARQYSELSDKSKEKYRRKAQEARKEQEEESDDDDDDDDEEDDDEPNKTGVGMYISHHLSTYMSENDMKKTPATAKLKATFEGLKKSERTPWVQKATESNKQAKRKQLDRQLLKGEPDKPLNSGYRIFTAEHMRSDEIKALPSTERIKAVAGKWRDLSAFGKKRYEAKKEKLLKDYKKEIDKYRKKLNKEDRDRYDELKKAGLSKYSREVTKKKPPVKRKKKAVASDEEEDEDSDDEENSDDDSDDDSSSASSGSGSEAASSDAASDSDEEEEEEEEEGDGSNSGQSSSASSSSSSASSGSSSSEEESGDEEEEEEENAEEEETKPKGKGKKGKEKTVIKQEPKENGEKDESGSSSESESSSSEASTEEDSD